MADIKDTPSSEEPDAGTEDRTPLELSGQQRALHESLSGKAQSLADMYLGSLTVLSDTRNPDRLALAAHGLRELMEKIPSFVDVRIKAQKEGLKGKVIELDVAWKATVENGNSYNGGTWSGEIDRGLSRFLRKLESFFQWFREHHPRRKAEIAATLEGLDPSGSSLPEPLAALNVETWENIRDFFVDVAHHRRPNTTGNEFSRWLDALERFLVDRLRPRTFPDLDAIDRIIREGEDHA